MSSVTVRLRLPVRTYRRLCDLKARLDASDYGEVARRALQALEAQLDGASVDGGVSGAQNPTP